MITMKKKKTISRKAEEDKLNVELSKIDLLSIAKIHGLIMLVLGFFLGLFTIFLSFIYRPNNVQVMNLYFISALLLLVSFALVYGVLGFIFGWIVAFIYNKSACRIGGIKWELKK